MHVWEYFLMTITMLALVLSMSFPQLIVELRGCAQMSGENNGSYSVWLKKYGTLIWSLMP